jgi:ribose transport system substrate-binding protein
MLSLASGCLVALSVLILFWARSLRARSRVAAARSGLVLLVLGLTATGYSLGVELNLQFSDNLQVASILLSVALGVGAGAVDRALHRMTVAIVIPSRAAFHTDLRRGLREGLNQMKVRYVDEFADGPSLENLSEFLPCLRKAIQERPDYLVIAAPGNAFVDEPFLLNSIERMARLGGRVFFIENCPTKLSPRAEKGIAVIRSDSTAGALVLAKFIATIWDGTSPVAIIAGPTESTPARTRFELLRDKVGVPEHLIVRTDVSGWSEAAGYEFAKEMGKLEPTPSIIVCGNDSIAVGAVRALLEMRFDDRVKVIGYDGIPQVIYAIAEPRNPLVATIRIPPAQYGFEIASQIFEDLHSPWLRRSRLSSVVITIGDANLVTGHNAEQIVGVY